MVTTSNTTISHYALMMIILLSLLIVKCYGLAATTTNPQPIDAKGWPNKFPAKEHCSKCGLCETTYVTHVKDACAFIGSGMRRNIDGMENTIHGRRRNVNDIVWDDNSSNDGVADEARFGVMKSPMMLAKGKGIVGAQWTGVVTGIAASMLESKMVDAVVCIASKDDQEKDGWSNPEPILARTVEQVMQGRGVKPALAPSLKVLDELKESSDIKRLLFCGVGCAVQAFRAVQDELDLDEVYVLGTNCADNSPTPTDASEFIRQGVPEMTNKKIKGYEFCQDFKVHIKYENTDGDIDYEKKPYFCLPGDVAEFAIAQSCLACFDYTNSLADIVVGYMGAPLNSQMDKSYQTITIRNCQGEKMIQSAINADRLDLGPQATGKGNHEPFTMATVSSDNLVQKMVGGKIKTQGMPVLLGNILAALMTNIGPKGTSFARYSIDYHLLRNYLHCLDFYGEETANKMLPEYSTDIVNYYCDKNDEFRKLVESIKSKE